jgi:hypothetical protein
MGFSVKILPVKLATTIIEPLLAKTRATLDLSSLRLVELVARIAKNG